MTAQYINKYGLSVHPALVRFLEDEVLPGLNLDTEKLWQAIANSIAQLQHENTALLEVRRHYQQQINNWIQQGNDVQNQPAYQQFLKDIGYIHPEPEDFTIATSHLDPEISKVCAPQLVVPVDNARYALNAANARWGSLYDALYGSDVLTSAQMTGFDQSHACKVIDYVNSFLDSVIPLASSQYKEVHSFTIDNGQLAVNTCQGTYPLKNPNQFAGYRCNQSGRINRILLRNHQLHIELCIDPEHLIGKLHRSNIYDVQLESAVTTIQDLEDSVAAVETRDKIHAWRNWLHLMQGTLTAQFIKNGKHISRSLNKNRHYTSPDGSALSLSGRSLLFVRNVGLLMTTDSIQDIDGNAVYEGIIDGWITALCSMHDLQGSGTSGNSKTGSIYIVKPKLHGQEEVFFVDKQCTLIEEALGLAKNTIKIGLMDEERRTSVNLKSCIQAAQERIFFINTGFLDRTGDEIHTSMLAGIMPRKADLKQAQWLTTYEQRNVAIGLDCGFSRKAQIGKGMWAMPDQMQAMIKQKSNHPQSGANCAWVPSPTAATLHAMHYHTIDVLAIQNNIKTPPDPIDKLLEVPLITSIPWNQQEIHDELDNNIQSILGYVVRWIDQGIGCSKIPDIHGTGLMEDRATLRISSQHIANWLHHSVVTIEEVDNSLKRMAQIVDEQNMTDPDYEKLVPGTSIAYACARDIITKAQEQPNGYTEPLLHAYRIKKKYLNLSKI